MRATLILAACASVSAAASGAAPHCDVRARPGREVGRTIVKGSEDGSAAIADLAACPQAAGHSVGSGPG